MSTGPSASAAGITLATILAATPFGVPIEHIAIGTFFSVAGVLCRGAYELQRNAEGSGTMKFLAVLSWVVSGLLGAPFVTVLGLGLLKIANIQTDSLMVIGFWYLGFSGPKGVISLWNMLCALVQKRTGVRIPVLPGEKDVEPPKP